MAFMNTNSKVNAMKASLEEDKPEFVETWEDVLRMRRALVKRYSDNAKKDGKQYWTDPVTWTKAWSTRGDERRDANRCRETTHTK